METAPNPQDREFPSPHNASSPNSSSSSSNNNGTTALKAHPSPPRPPLTPKTHNSNSSSSIPRSSDPNNPYPTTFIQADPNSFKHVVQMLTGSAETAAKHSSTTPSPKSSIPPASSNKQPTGPKKPAFKLYERRGSLKHLKMISPLLPAFLGSAHGSPSSSYSPQQRKTELLSPSMLDFPSLALSPVTPLSPDPFNRGSPNPGSASSSVSEEDRAIAQKGFYLHPSPRTTTPPPRLLPLFPVTSPRASSALFP